MQSIFDCFIVFLAFINRRIHISGAREDVQPVIVELLDGMNSLHQV